MKFTNERDSHFFLAGWNGARRDVVASAHFQNASKTAPASCLHQIQEPTPVLAASVAVVLPEPDFWVRPGATIHPDRGWQCWSNDGTATGAFHAETVRALLATGGQAQAVPVANCYSDDDGDTWRDCPDDCEFVEGRALGEEFELQASIRSWKEVFRVTKVPDETSDDYEVEPVSIRATAAPQAQADARDAEWLTTEGRAHGFRVMQDIQGAVVTHSTASLRSAITAAKEQE